MKLPRGAGSAAAHREPLLLKDVHTGMPQSERGAIVAVDRS
ncbi:MAG TPA: hypothetical protein VK824_03865 [Planctomycetota bacterium]|nr:hypothetical protein [Planctomycetota bacterium]